MELIKNSETGYGAEVEGQMGTASNYENRYYLEINHYVSEKEALRRFKKQRCVSEFYKFGLEYSEEEFNELLELDAFKMGYITDTHGVGIGIGYKKYELSFKDESEVGARFYCDNPTTKDVINFFRFVKANKEQNYNLESVSEVGKPEIANTVSDKFAYPIGLADFTKPDTKRPFLTDEELREKFPEAIIHGNSNKVHKNAYISGGVVLSGESVIKSGATIHAGCRVGRDCIIYENVVIGSKSVVGDGVVIEKSSTIAPFTVLVSGLRIMEKSLQVSGSASVSAGGYDIWGYKFKGGILMHCTQLDDGNMQVFYTHNGIKEYVEAELKKTGSPEKTENLKILGNSAWFIKNCLEPVILF